MYFTCEGQEASLVDVIIADASDEKSIDALSRRAKVIINCCGPFSLYGEPVVKACIRNGTHHVDITAEPEVLEVVMTSVCTARAQQRGRDSLDRICKNLYLVNVSKKYECTKEDMI